MQDLGLVETISTSSVIAPYGLKVVRCHIAASEPKDVEYTHFRVSHMYITIATSKGFLDFGALQLDVYVPTEFGDDQVVMK